MINYELCGDSQSQQKQKYEGKYAEMATHVISVGLWEEAFLVYCSAIWFWSWDPCKSNDMLGISSSLKKIITFHFDNIFQLFYYRDK